MSKRTSQSDGNIKTNDLKGKIPLAVQGCAVYKGILVRLSSHLILFT